MLSGCGWDNYDEYQCPCYYMCWQLILTAYITQLDLFHNIFNSKVNTTTICHTSNKEHNTMVHCIFGSQNMSRFQALPSQSELAEMKEDLAFKEGEMKKSEHTTVGLAQGISLCNSNWIEPLNRMK